MKTVVDVRAAPHVQGQRIDLNWQLPPTSAFDGSPPLAGIRIVRRQRSFPLTTDDGDVVHDGPIISAFSDVGLQPLTTYYYTIFTVDAASTPVYYADDRARVAAFVTENYNLAERLYRLLPAVHQRHDTPLDAAELAQLDPAVAEALRTLPAPLRQQGQLRRFFHAAAPLDLMRSFAEGLRDLRNVNQVRPEFLPLLAHWLGWEPDRTLPIPTQRHEVSAAPHLYRTVGTIPNLRSIVTRYTGWYTQVAEFTQSIARTNQPSQLNIFTSLETPDGWRGTDDAAPVLGFAIGNHDATGGTNGTAALVSTTTAPFALRPGMELAITADAHIPVVVRFQSGDFAAMAQAMAAEVVAVLNRNLTEVSAMVQGDGRIELRSNTVGATSLLRIETQEASLVTLEGAPHGRLSTFVDQQERMRLFYTVADPLAATTAQAASEAFRATPGALSPITAARPQGRVRYKTYRSGSWGPSATMTTSSTAAEGDPAAVALPDGRIWAAWIDQPHTGDARLRFQVGAVQTPQPARLHGRRGEPFRITPGTRLMFWGHWPEAEGCEFAAADFANPQQATAAEVAAALNARLAHVLTTVQPNNTLVIETRTSGGDAHIELELPHSTSAQVLGLEHLPHRATGDWGDGIEWSEAEEITAATAGRHADLHAMADATGAVWLFWSSHTGLYWCIMAARWDGAAWSAPLTLANEPGGNREPYAVLDDTNRLWLFWSRREGVGTADDTWTLRRRVFDPASGQWGVETAVTTPPANGRVADREPGAVRAADGTLRLFFSSDRSGSTDLWSVLVFPVTGAVGTAAIVKTGQSIDRAPTPLLLPEGALWLFYRSDRSVPMSRLMTQPQPMVENRVTSAPAGPPKGQVPLPHSLPMPDSGTLKRFAGTTSVTMSDSARIRRQRLWDDLLAYTPQRPPGGAIRNDELYTRGTVGLFLSRLVSDDPLTQQQIARLRAVLERFLPINVRAVVILAPRVDLDFVYRLGADIEDTYADVQSIGAPPGGGGVKPPDPDDNGGEKPTVTPRFLPPDISNPKTGDKPTDSLLRPRTF